MSSASRESVARKVAQIKDARERQRADDAPAVGIAQDELEDAVDVAAQGQQIAAQGVPYVWAGIIPMLGMLGFLVAFAKVGKTTFGQALAAHIASGLEFLERPVVAVKVLILAPEDPPEYTAWLARHIRVEPGRLFFRRRPLVLTDDALSKVSATVRNEGFGLVLIASWQAVVRGLIRDENDNAGAVQIVERVKIAARETGVPWLIDAHSGKGEDQSDDADPSKAMRGASGAAGAADYTLSLRYANGTFGTQRRLSGKGRFVSFPPLTLDFDAATSTYTLSGSSKDVGIESTWRQICEMGALTETPQSAADIAKIAGLIRDDERLGGAARQRIYAALNQQTNVLRTDEMRHGKKVTLFSRGVL